MDTREINKEKRRLRILKEARAIISKGGFDALTTRRLADAADVTAPTIYNLFGSKEDVLKALIREALNLIEERFSKVENVPPLDMAEAIVLQTVDLFRREEAYYKAAIVAGGQVTGTHDGSLKVSKRAISMAEKACSIAIDAGHLRGNILAGVIAEQMFACYRLPLRDWAFGKISIGEFKKQALRGFYLCLAADASAKYRVALLKKVENLGPARASKAKVA